MKITPNTIKVVDSITVQLTKREAEFLKSVMGQFSVDALRNAANSYALLVPPADNKEAGEFLDNLYDGLKEQLT